MEADVTLRHAFGDQILVEDRSLDELHLARVDSTCEVPQLPRAEIVEDEDRVPAGDHGIGQLRPDETCPPSYQVPHAPAFLISLNLANLVFPPPASAKRATR